MKHWKHLYFDQRKLISHMLIKKYKLVEMSDLLQVDASSISKEIRRNRFPDKKGIVLDQVCKHSLRFPYVCNGCAKKYHACPCLHGFTMTLRKLRALLICTKFARLQ